MKTVKKQKILLHTQNIFDLCSWRSLKRPVYIDGKCFIRIMYKIRCDGYYIKFKGEIVKVHHVRELDRWVGDFIKKEHYTEM